MTNGDKTLGEWEFVVELGKVREFARAVKDVCGEGTDIAPPTFPVVASSEFVERLVVSVLKLDRARTVHGEQEFEYFEPLRAGDRLRCRARLVNDETKTGRRGGSMRIITTAVDYICATTDTLVCRETMTTI